MLIAIYTMILSFIVQHEAFFSSPLLFTTDIFFWQIERLYLIYMIWLLLGSFVVFVFYQGWVGYTQGSGAPYIVTPPDVVERIVDIADVGSNDVVYDLGSGDGRVVIAAAMKGAKAIGIETDLLRVIYSRLWIKLLRLDNKAKVIHGDIYKTKVTGATVVTCYLLPETHRKLEKKFKGELGKGTKIVAVAFELPGLKPEKVDPRGVIYGPLYLYCIS
jgi:hypothetical protein